MTDLEKMNEIEEILELEEGTLKLNSNLSDFEEWDSLSKLTLMAFMKKKFSISLDISDIRGFETVKDICDYITNNVEGE